MKRWQLTTISLLVAMSTPGVVAAAANPGTGAKLVDSSKAPCHVESTSYAPRPGPRYNVWIGTSTYSHWVGGPGSITWSKTESATSTSGKSSGWSGGGGINWGVLSAKVERQWGKQTSRSTTKSSSWSYQLIVPRHQTARAMVYKLGYDFPARIRKIYKKGCGVLQRTYKGRVFMPYSSNDASMYCVVRDGYPGRHLIRSCRAH